MTSPWVTGKAQGFLGLTLRLTLAIPLVGTSYSRHATVLCTVPRTVPVVSVRSADPPRSPSTCICALPYLYLVTNSSDCTPILHAAPLPAYVPCPLLWALLIHSVG